MGKALYRKYRSRKLSDIVGQSHVTDLLSSALKTNRISHAYLFTGPRGTGKTSIARILAHEINNLPYNDESTHLDIIEIDAASNNGVDDIRDLRERVQLAPSSATKKIYIIDEVHMLSKPAFNALLKTLEEPPEHVVFILATTDVDKLPETIVSRTQRYTFHKASTEDIIINLKRIAAAEKIIIDDEALQLIAEHSDGSFRDSVSLLDQLNGLADSTISAATVENSLGLVPSNVIVQLANATRDGKFDEVLSILNQLETSGHQASITSSQLVSYIVRNALDYPGLLKIVTDLLDVPKSLRPNSSLLAILGVYTADKPTKLMKSAIPAKGIIDLENKALEPHPKDDIRLAEKTPESRKNTINTTKNTNESAGTDLDWQMILDSAKKSSIGLQSILHKCSHKITDTKNIVIYTRNEFYRKKLESPKQIQSLHKTLKDVTGTEWQIELIGSVAPPKDSALAAITDMMGGGEEIILEDDT